MTGFDWLVLAGIPVAGYIGYRLGFLVAVTSFGGFAIGILLGLAGAPVLLTRLEPGPLQALLAFAIVLGIGVLCQAVGSYLGGALKDVVAARRLLRFDAAVGALMAVVSLLGFAWLVGSAAQRAGHVPFVSSVRDSRLVSVLATRIPLNSDSLLATFGTLIDRSGFPAVFSDTGLERIEPVGPADPAILGRPGISRAASSIVKVLGTANACHRSLEGSGFVIAPQRVITNAHVVAGTDVLQVFRQDSMQSYFATVVFFDPETDLAVLRVPYLSAPVLPAGPELSRGASAVVAGYPGDGPLVVTAARVRGSVWAVGRDIYGTGSVEREIYSLRTQIRSGNSGGPLLDADGRYVGVVFAASVDDPSTGYALRPSEMTSAVRIAEDARGTVSTQGCSP